MPLANKFKPALLFLFLLAYMEQIVSQRVEAAVNCSNQTRAECPFNIFGEPLVSENCEGLTFRFFFSNNSGNFWEEQVIPFWQSQLTNQTQNFNYSDTNYSTVLDLFANIQYEQKQVWLQLYYIWTYFGTRFLGPMNLTQIIFLSQSLLNSSSLERWSILSQYFHQVSNQTICIEEEKEDIIKFCKSNLPCEYCLPGYGLSNQSRCSQCLPYCLNCSQNSSRCIECYQPFFINKQAKCQKCQLFNCDICTNQSNCKVCMVGFGLNQRGQCTKCGQNCEECNQNITCSKCSIGYNQEPNQNGICIQCEQIGCKTCNIQNISQCQKCFPGFSLKSFVCQNLTVPGICRSINCQTCLFGFRQNNNMCQKCKDFTCKTCKNNQNQCDSCFDGFSLNQSSKKCQLQQKIDLCQEGCEYCYINKNCRKCSDFFYLNTIERSCKKCGEGCKSCKNSQKCSLCQEIGFTLNKQTEKCTSCPQSCKTCFFNQSNQIYCQSCYFGFRLNNGDCQKINIDHCLKISNRNFSQCGFCQPGFTVSSAGKCMKCLNSCTQSCSSKNISFCTQNKQQIIQPGLTFSLVSQGCLFFINQNCFIPQNGYKIDVINNSLIATYSCSFPCQKCNSQGCLECPFGFNMSQSKCLLTPCKNNCTNCSIGTFKQINGSCTICSTQNCSQCPSDICSKCFKGYYLQNNQCLSCPIGCIECEGNFSCTSCKRGFFNPTQISNQSRSICIKCSQKCQTCIFHSQVCTSCKQSQFLLNSKCYKKDSLMFEFKFKISLSQFMDNQYSLILSQKLIRTTNLSGCDLYLTQLIQDQQNPVLKGGISADSQQALLKSFDLILNNSLSPPIQLISFVLSYKTKRVQCYPNQKQNCPTPPSPPINNQTKHGYIKPSQKNRRQQSQQYDFVAVLGIVFVVIAGILLCLMGIFAVYRRYVRSKLLGAQSLEKVESADVFKCKDEGLNKQTATADKLEYFDIQ